MIRKLKYKNRTYSLRIGYKALKGVVQELGREFDGTSDTFDFEGAESLLFHGLKQGASFTGKDFELRRDEMEDVLDECFDDFIAAFVDFSQAPGKKGSTRARKKRQP